MADLQAKGEATKIEGNHEEYEPWTPPWVEPDRPRSFARLSTTAYLLPDTSIMASEGQFHSVNLKRWSRRERDSSFVALERVARLAAVHEHL